MAEREGIVIRLESDGFQSLNVGRWKERLQIWTKNTPKPFVLDIDMDQAKTLLRGLVEAGVEYPTER
jgi:hypothetical protein